MGCCSCLFCHKTHDSKQQHADQSHHQPSNSQKGTIDLSNNPLSQRGNKYEVLLSYSSGDDTPESFCRRLYSSLREARISVLKSDDISIELLQSIIEGSKILIIIFSEHYISSRRCLEELTKIMELRRVYNQVVLPIFYLVNQDAVRNHDSSSGLAFQDCIRRISPIEHEYSRWTTAVSEAGAIHGFVVPNIESKTEREAIQNIVNRVCYTLDMGGPFVKDDGLVGVSSQVEEVITMLEKHLSKDFVSIGIWGMGGIGKTTIARVIFDHIQYDFHRTFFLSNVREEWKKKEGKYNLQRKLHSAIIDVFEAARLGIDRGRVLFVFDDVNDMEQIYALCAKIDLTGSIVIITTRDLDLLKAMKVDDVYSMKLLSDHESLQLFNGEAFKQASPEGEFIQLSRRMVTYAEGLPLALKVFGSFLAGKSLIGWESALMKLSTDLPRDIYNTLKYSLDSLDGNQKEIFLNIVLFYIGEDTDDVIQKLDGHGCNASIGIRVLVDRSLVTIDENNKLRMHNVLQLVGRQIICESSQNELPNRGRLCFCEDAYMSFTYYISNMHVAMIINTMVHKNYDIL